MERKIENTDEFRRWVKIRCAEREISMSELGRRIGAPSSRISEAVHGKPKGRKYIPIIIRALEGKEEDFKEVLRAGKELQ